MAFCHRCGSRGSRAPPSINLTEEPSEDQLEIVYLNSEIKKLQEKLQNVQDTLSEHLNSKNTAMKTDGEEILPWHFKLTALQEEYLSLPDIMGHVKVFRSFLTEYAVCFDVSSNSWLWYEWTQRLWIITDGSEMIPLLVKLVHEFDRRGVKLDPSLTKNTLQLRSIISILKTRLADHAGIRFKLNRNEHLVSLDNGKVLDLRYDKVRYRTREDYFSCFISNGVVISQHGVDLPKRFSKQNEELESFFRGMIVPNTNKNTTVIGILSSQLYDIYTKWCNDEYLECESRKTLITFLESKGFDRKRLSDGYHWLGIDGPFL